MSDDTNAIVVNGVRRPLAATTTVATVVSTVTAVDSGCAVAVNGEVVPRHDWDDRTLCSGDQVEILTAVQGG